MRGAILTWNILTALVLAGGATDTPVPGRSALWLGPKAERVAGEAATGSNGFLPTSLRFGWCSPPSDSSDIGHLEELKEAGFNVVLPAVDDPWTTASNFRRMEAAAAVGLRCWVWDDALHVDPDSPSGIAVLDSLVPRYASHPGFLGFYLGDEPPRESFGELGKLAAALRSRSPGHPTFSDLLGRANFPSREAYVAYLAEFLDAVQPPLLCANYYPFLESGDRPGFVEHLSLLGGMARARGLPWLQVIQLVQHWQYRPITEGELRWQLGHVLAYGARGFCYFTYWTPPPDPFWNFHEAMITRSGLQTPYYDMTRRLNAEVAGLGDLLGTSTWIATEHAGSVPLGGARFEPGRGVRGVEGRAALGYFLDSAGKPLLLVVNSDSSAAQSVRLHLAGVARLERWDVEGARLIEADSPRGVVTLALAPGGLALLRFPDGEPSLAGRPTGPLLSISPNPGRGSVRLSVMGAVGQVRIELLDSLGRRVWSREGTGDQAAWQWSGEGRSGTSPAGIYHVRVQDGRGTTIQKLAWRP